MTPRIPGCCAPPRSSGELTITGFDFTDTQTLWLCIDLSRPHSLCWTEPDLQLNHLSGAELHANEKLNRPRLADRRDNCGRYARESTCEHVRSHSADSFIDDTYRVLPGAGA